MRRRRSFRPFHSTRRTRKWEWIYVQHDFSSSTSGGIDLLADWRTRMGITANLPDMTVSRVRGVVQLQALVPGDVGPFTHVTCATLVWPTPQAAALPQPETDMWQDWNYYESIVLSGFGPYEPPAAPEPVYAKYVDIKAQRRLKNIDDSYFFTWQTPSAHALYLQLAIGVKLP